MQPMSMCLQVKDYNLVIACCASNGKPSINDVMGIEYPTVAAVLEEAAREEYVAIVVHLLVPPVQMAQQNQSNQEEEPSIHVDRLILSMQEGLDEWLMHVDAEQAQEWIQTDQGTQLATRIARGEIKTEIVSAAELLRRYQDDPSIIAR